MLTKEQKSQIVSRYLALEPMISIAKSLNVSRQYVHRIIRDSGADTTKHKIPVSCLCCGKEVLRHKFYIRKIKRTFCSQNCYYAWLDSLDENTYIHSRQGRRVARTIASKFFKLQPSHIVHHIDKNTLNNNPDNLIVFANQGDHIRYHRGFPSHFLWNGAVEKWSGFQKI